MRHILAIVALCACGGGAAGSLPVLPIPPGVRATSPRVAFQAIDAPGADILFTFLDRESFVQRPSHKRLTGRVEGSRADVAAAIALAIGVDLTPHDFGGSGPTLDLAWSAWSARDLVHAAAQVGGVNLVAPGELGELTIRLKNIPWDGALHAMAAVLKRDVVRVGNVIYLLPAGTKLPEPPKLPEGAIVDLRLDGTVAHATAALRKVTTVPGDHCGGPTFQLYLREVTAAEALRALAVMSGHALDGPACPATELDGPQLADDKVAATVVAGDRRSATIDRARRRVVATIGAHIKSIASDDFGVAGSLDVYFTPTRRERGEAVVRRTSALVHEGGSWSAWVDLGNDYWRIVKTGDQELGVTFTVDASGVHTRDAAGTVQPLPLTKR